MAHKQLLSKKCLNCKSVIKLENFVSEISFKKTKYCSEECRSAAAHLSKREFKRRKRAEKRGVRYTSTSMDGLREMLTQNLRCSFEKCNAKATTFFESKCYCVEHFRSLKKELIWDWHDNRYVKKHRGSNWNIKNDRTEE